MAKVNLRSLFKGTESDAEERREKNALKSGKISKQQFIRGERMEGEKSKDISVPKFGNGGMVMRGAGAATKGKKFTRAG
jgi:hypothetical protein